MSIADTVRVISPFAPFYAVIVLTVPCLTPQSGSGSSCSSSSSNHCVLSLGSSAAMIPSAARVRHRYPTCGFDGVAELLDARLDPTELRELG